MPLLTQVGRSDDEDATLALGPALRDNQPSLDRFAQPNLVGEQSAFGERRRKSEKRGIDLVRVHIDLRTGNGDG